MSINQLKQKAEELQRMIEAEELRRRLARGTRDVGDKAQELAEGTREIQTDLTDDVEVVIGLTQDQLRCAVRKLIKQRPMTTRELADTTHVTARRVRSALADIRNEGVRVSDVGSGSEHRWYIANARRR